MSLYRWFMQRVFRKIKQRYPIEVYVHGRRIVAGSGKIEMDLDSEYDAVIKIERPFK